MAKKRGNIGWRPGRYRARRRPLLRAGPRKLTPILDVVVAVAAALLLMIVVAGSTLVLAVNYSLPLYAAFALIMAGMTAVAYMLRPRGRIGVVLVGLIFVLGFGGATMLYLGRYQVRLPAVHHHPAADRATRPAA